MKIFWAYKITHWLSSISGHVKFVRLSFEETKLKQAYYHNQNTASNVNLERHFSSAQSPPRKNNVQSNVYTLANTLRAKAKF